MSLFQNVYSSLIKIISKKPKLKKKKFHCKPKDISTLRLKSEK